MLFLSRVRAKYNQKAAKIQGTELILSSKRTIVRFCGKSGLFLAQLVNWEAAVGKQK